MKYDELRQYYQERAKEQLREQCGEYLSRAVDGYRRYGRRRRFAGRTAVAAMAAVAAGALLLTRPPAPQQDVDGMVCNANCSPAEVLDNLDILMS